MELAVQSLILAFLLFAVPTVVGGLSAKVLEKKGGKRDICFRWVSGQMILWAGFQVISVPLILAERPFHDVVLAFSGYMAAMFLLGVAAEIRRFAVRKPEERQQRVRGERDPAVLFLWCCAGGLLLLQLVLACLLAYEEGDDAYYVAVSTVTEYSDRMYYHLPYTGGTTSIDGRHSLAPMPIWVAYLARVSGMKVVTLAQIALPLALILMCGAIYLMLGRRLFPEGGKKLPLFLLFLQMLVLFGGYSTYSAENFLLVRTAQGKAILANIVIPFLFLLFLVILERLQEDGKTGAACWLLVGLTMVTGCLCSTQGTLLTCIFLGAAGSCAVICYRRWRLLIPMAGCGIIPVCTALLYFWLD